MYAFGSEVSFVHLTPPKTNPYLRIEHSFDNLSYLD